MAPLFQPAVKSLPKWFLMAVLATATGCPSTNVCSSCYLELKSDASGKSTAVAGLQLADTAPAEQQKSISITIWDIKNNKTTTTYVVPPFPPSHGEQQISGQISGTMSRYELVDLKLPPATPASAEIEIDFADGYQDSDTLNLR